jgi:hypothetical protein
MMHQHFLHLWIFDLWAWSYFLSGHDIRPAVDVVRCGDAEATMVAVGAVGRPPATMCARQSVS